MHVLHVHSGNVWGGVETFLETLAREERSVSSLRSEFALCFRGVVADRLRETGAAVHPLAPVRLARPGSVRTARLRLTSLLSSLAPDVIVIHSTWTAAVFGPVLARAARPVALWAHAPDPGPRWQRLLARRCPVHVVVANSTFTRMHRPPDRDGARVECVYYPVRPRPAALSRAAVRASLGVTPDEPVILLAARLEPWKGHALLVEALGRLPADVGWRCWIAGGVQRAEEGAHGRALRERVAALSLTPRVQFLGLRSDVPDLLAAADVYCQPNTGPEPFGISFVEALWAGLPVVTTRLGAATEIVDDTCGRLTAPGDPAALAAALEGLLRSPAERRALGDGGPRKASTLCAPDTQIRRIETVLASLRPWLRSTVAS
jgi:glycosyltransferase involved in cell wall biosynthesis